MLVCVCWCVCGHAHTAYSQIKTKVTEYLRVLFLSSDDCMVMGRWKAKSPRISLESCCYAAHKSCLRRSLRCFVVWQRDGESLNVRLRFKACRHSVLLETAIIVPWLKPEAGAREEQTRTGGNELLWSSHNTSPQICWHTQETEPFISPPARFPHCMQNRKSDDSLQSAGQLKHFYYIKLP